MICQISKKSFLDDFSFWSFAMLKRLKKKKLKFKVYDVGNTSTFEVPSGRYEHLAIFYGKEYLFS